MERKIDVTTARRQLGTLLDEVFYKGDIFTIERKGKPLAQIIPFKEVKIIGRFESIQVDTRPAAISLQQGPGSE